MNMEPYLTSVGMLVSLRCQCHTLMYVSVRSIAYQPPPTALKDGPKLDAREDFVPQPSVGPCTSQSVLRVVL